jgi:hypothetical protein
LLGGVGLKVSSCAPSLPTQGLTFKDGIRRRRLHKGVLTTTKKQETNSKVGRRVRPLGAARAELYDSRRARSVLAGGACLMNTNSVQVDVGVGEEGEVISCEL